MSIDESGASVVTAELSAFSAAHEGKFLQLFQNLVGNAHKIGCGSHPGQFAMNVKK
jgi:hypothetical protein